MQCDPANEDPCANPVDLGVDDVDGATTPASPSGGNDEVTSVAEALVVLNNQACSTATHCLAAQLLVALLDIRKDPTLDHSCIDDDIATARSYLDANGYSVDGPDPQAAKTTAGILNLWNNSGCP